MLTRSPPDVDRGGKSLRRAGGNLGYPCRSPSGRFRHHFPHRENAGEYQAQWRNVANRPIGFIVWQLLGLQPLAAPIWLCVVERFLFSDVRQGRTVQLGDAICCLLLLLRLTMGDSITSTGLADAVPQEP